MSVEQEIAAPALLARIEAVSPWQTPARANPLRHWLSAIANAWREGMELYMRAGIHRGHWGGF